MSEKFQVQANFIPEDKTIMTLQNATEHIELNRKMGISLMGNMKQFIQFQNLIQLFFSFLFRSFVKGLEKIPAIRLKQSSMSKLPVPL
jgi:hypothetical protein